MYTLFILFLSCTGLLGLPTTGQNDTDPALTLFREYLKIDTSVDDNLSLAVEFWRRQALDVGLVFKVHYPATKPVCVLTWPGLDQTLPSIMLNSHMDIVPANADEWKYPPFEAHIDEDGNIYGRGSQDDKCIAIQYLEAIRKIKNNNVRLQRTLHITLMPDEEIGSPEGMVLFVNTSEFRQLEVGFVLDEGIATPSDDMVVTYLDKRPWQVNFTMHGGSGHGSALQATSDNAMSKINKLTNAIMEYRHLQELIKAAEDPANITIVRYNTININMVNGGTRPNIIPSAISLVVDIRLSPLADVAEMQALIDSWAEIGGDDTEVSYVRKIFDSPATALDSSNIYWQAMKEVSQEMGLKLTPIVCPATSDMIFVRPLGIPAFGFSPTTNTTSRMHGNNEYLNVKTFLKGIDTYVKFLLKLGNLPCGKAAQVDSLNEY